MALGLGPDLGRATEHSEARELCRTRVSLGRNTLVRKGLGLYSSLSRDNSQVVGSKSYWLTVSLEPVPKRSRT